MSRISNFYKKTYFVKRFNNTVQELSKSQETKKKKKNNHTINTNDSNKITDNDVALRIRKNFQKLSLSNENEYILKSLKSDISLYPSIVSEFIKKKKKSISDYFQNAFIQPRNPKLLLEVINNIIDLCENEFATYFSSDIFDIFQLLQYQYISEFATKLIIRIMENSDDSADIFMFDDAFNFINQVLKDNNIHLLEKFVRIIEVSARTCHNDNLKSNKYSLIPLLHTLYFICDQSICTKVVFCFRMLLEKADCKPSVVLPNATFEKILIDFSQNPSNEYLYLFNTILHFDNIDPDPEIQNTFFLDNINFFNILINSLQNSNYTRMILRLFANFSYVEPYCELILSEKIYESIFELLVNDDLPFKLRDDPCLFFCRLFSFSPDNIAVHPYFTDLFYITSDVIESSHSSFLTESFFIMFDKLDEYLQKTQIDFNIDINDILIYFTDSDDPEIAQWASLKLDPSD